MARGHTPVLLQETLTLLAPEPGEVFLDGTTGAGGHAAELARKIGPDGVLVCADAAGNERWRHAGASEGVEAVGAPIAIDALVAVPYRASGEDRLELRVLAVSARDGRLVWDAAVGQVAQAGESGDRFSQGGAAL